MSFNKYSRYTVLSHQVEFWKSRQRRGLNAFTLYTDTAAFPNRICRI